MDALRLRLTEYQGPERWRWVLESAAGAFLGGHEVRIDPATRWGRGFAQPHAYLDERRAISTTAAELEALGRWMGEAIFGPLREKLLAHVDHGGIVRVILPTEAQALLTRPFELARFADGSPFTDAGLTFVYQTQSGVSKVVPKPKLGGPALRILGVFSLPEGQHPLNLRRERYGLQRFVRNLCQTRGLAVTYRALQYGATRKTLKDALEDGDGWDIVHFSGHGEHGVLVLEDEAGAPDVIDSTALAKLLRPARDRLSLLILDACYSGAGQHEAVRARVGLEPSTRQDSASAAPAPVAATPLPSLAQTLAQTLDCAAVAMRYPVGDTFATDLMLALYPQLLDKSVALPTALNRAVEAALAGLPGTPLAAVTAMLVGERAATLKLTPPSAAAVPFALPRTGLAIGFPPEPDRFVGRGLPMLRASQALAPNSPKRGVLFYGMPGAGKTTCALELAYRHAAGRFQGHVWYQAPEAGSDVASALSGLMFEIERQLGAPGLGLQVDLDRPDVYRAHVLPRFRALLQDHAILLVLDNLESLLSDSGAWQDALWGDVLAALLDHRGLSRVVLTSRRVPAGLADHEALQHEAIHALSFDESVLLALEFPHLRGLFDDEPGKALLRGTLRVVQGHPKLLDLANGLASDRAALATRVAESADAVLDRTGRLDAFFAPGGASTQTEADFTAELGRWTAGVVGRLAPTARLLFAFLCRIEPGDRRDDVVGANWKDFLTRLGDGHAAAQLALAEPQEGFRPALAALDAAGLVAVAQRRVGEGDDARSVSTYTLHPGVVEAALADVPKEVLDAADGELGAFHATRLRRTLEGGMQERGDAVVAAARAAVPYLLRLEEWKAASWALEQLLHRDMSPASQVFALPLLRRIAEATAGTERALDHRAVVARTLTRAGRFDEAETPLRDTLAQGVAAARFRPASNVAGDLVDLLRARGRLAEALAMAEEKAGHTRRAGLGPWTQLADEGRRLQVLAAMGHYDEVLAAVETLLPELEALPLTSAAEEAANPWNVRESLLGTGRMAALRSKRWERALDLNARIQASEKGRGALPLERSATRFNDYGPLLRLARFNEARALLDGCHATFEAERQWAYLGKVYGALAELENETGERDAAVRYEHEALLQSYRAGEPEGCAISHNNLSHYLERTEADPAMALSHAAAAAAICLQTGSGLLPTALGILALSPLPPTPPPFDAVVATVQQVLGVRFRALFDGLPQPFPDGDAALAEVWRRVAGLRSA